MRPFYYLISALLITLSLSTASKTFGQQAGGYESTIQSANEKFDSKDYISAKTYYEMALRQKPEDVFAQKRLNETISLIQKQNELQEVFYGRLDQGDQLLKADKLEEALQSYRKALEIFPQDKYVNAQVTTISTKLKNEADRKNKFQENINLGNQLYDNQKFEEALVQFNLAAALEPADTNVKGKIKTTEAAIAKRKADELNFQTLISEADELVKRKNYGAATEKLNQAIQIFPGQENAVAKLSEVKALSERQNAYDAKLEIADKAFENKELENARELYEQALAIWPNQSYAADMVQRINQTLNNEELNRQKAIETSLTEAATLFESGQWEASLATYNQVLGLDAENKLATDRVVELTGLIAKKKAEENARIAFNDLLLKAEKFMDQNQPDQALSVYQDAGKLFPDDPSLQPAIAKATQLQRDNLAKFEKQQQYLKTVAEADVFYQTGAYESAKTAYESAAKLDPSQVYPTQQLLLVEKSIAEAIILKEKNNAYEALVTEADAFFNTNDYQSAIGKYRQALDLKPTETYPANQISLAEKAIQNLKELAKLDKDFDDFMTQAESAESNKKLTEALALYQKASLLKPNEITPKQRIEQLNLLIAAAEAAQKTEATYRQLIASGEESFSKQSYNEALANFKQAASLMPAEPLATERIAEINKILADLQAQAEIEKKYNDLMQLADQQFESGKYSESIRIYKEAQQLNPSSGKSEEQITLAEKKLAELEAFKQKELQIINLMNEGEAMAKQGNLPEAVQIFQQVLELDPNHLAASAGKAEAMLAMETIAKEQQSRYEAAMAEAEQLITTKEYKLAITSLKQALGYKPNDPAASQRISQVETILEERLMALKSEYNKFVNEADRFYNTQSFDQAIEKYLAAENIKPDETYPREMIKKIAARMEENKIRELNSTLVVVPSNTKKRFDFEPVDITERRSNYIVVKARNMGEGSFPLLVSFGSKSGRNGGFVLPIPENADLNDFIVRIGQQYKWFSEDNTWIEFLPENGDVEIGMIQISKSN